MAITEADVQTRLRALIDPNTGKDFVSGKAVKKIQVGAGDVVVDIQLGYPAKTQHESSAQADRRGRRASCPACRASPST